MRKRLLLLFALLLLPALVLQAQGAPDQINAAVADLAQRLGISLTLDNLDDWRWAQEDFGDTSLGCPQPDVGYAQVVTPGYIFTLTYGGKVYDYRVSADSRVVILCSEQTLEEAASATPTPVDPNFTDPYTLCLNPEAGRVYQPSRLTVGLQAQVATGGAPNNLRAEPNTSAAVLAEIPPNAVFTIQGGPECGNGLLWWQVNYDGTVGWTAEGEGADYWLEPIPGRALPTGLVPITATNAATVAELSQVELNATAMLAASKQGAAAAVLGGRGTDGLWVFDNLFVGELRPRLLRTEPETPTQFLSLDFSSANPTEVVIGDLLGNVRVWDVGATARLQERVFLQGHQSDVGAVAYAPDGQRIASVGSIANTLADVDKNNAIIVWDLATIAQVYALGGHSARVNTLAFSPDGSLLASGSGAMISTTPDNTVRLWDMTNGQPLATLEGHAAPVRDVVFSPDGTQIASADMGGTVILWDVATRSQTRSWQAAQTGVVALAFSPDGSLLASAGGDPNASPGDFAIYLWDVQGGETLSQLTGHTTTVGSVAFSADGRVLLSADDARIVRFWGTQSAGSVG